MNNQCIRNDVIQLSSNNALLAYENVEHFCNAYQKKKKNPNDFLSIGIINLQYVTILKNRMWNMLARFSS